MISSVIEVILMSICSAVTPDFGAGDLEIHVAEMILVAEDIRQHGKAFRLLDQPHRDPRHRAGQAARRHPSAKARRRTPRPSTTTRSIR